MVLKTIFSLLINAVILLLNYLVLVLYLYKDFLYYLPPELWPTFECVIALLPNIIIWLITLKLLHLEYFVAICCSATFSTATTWSVVWKCISIAK